MPPGRPTIWCCAWPDALSRGRPASAGSRRWLVAHGQSADHVGDLGRHGASDAAIWEFALEAAAAIITKDEDFAQRKALVVASPAVVWIRLPNTRRQDLLAWFETALPIVLAALERGDTLIELI